MNSYRELVVWQRAMDLVEEVYELSRLLPREERYALTDQLRRAAVSIPSNIAEGYGRNSRHEYVRFLNIARGSKNEVQTQLLICTRLGYLSEEQVETAFLLCEEIGKLVHRLVARLLPAEE